MTAAPVSQPVRVAIYTRKSVADGLEQSFNTLDAQRQAIENYVQSQAGLGWVATGKHYDDGGFSGSTTERPAFQDLLRDIEAGHVDVVAVYKIDRLSRSLRDFAKLIDFFEQHNVTFVSVTQQFSTANSMGRLTLNILMSFAEFEREVISERIRDKVQATRRRGAWTGGRPLLGYDVINKTLVANHEEAKRVSTIYGLYLELGCLRTTVAELRNRDWTNKLFTTKDGRTSGGRSFSKATLHALLTNVIYRGQLRCGEDMVEGQHDPIVDEPLWQAVQDRLAANRANGGATSKNKTGAVLRGLMACGRCGSAMIHTFSTKRGRKDKTARRYRYYVCNKAHTEGREACPDARVPPGHFEQFVADRLCGIGKDEHLVRATAEAMHEAARRERARLTREHDRLTQLHAQLSAARRELLETATENSTARVGERISDLDRQLIETDGELERVGLSLRDLDDGADEDAVRNALGSFTETWNELFPREQERILRLLVEHVVYQPDTCDVELRLRAAGIETLNDEAPGART